MADVVVRFARQDEVKTLQDLNDEVFVDNSKYDPDLRLDWAQSVDGGQQYFTELVNNPDSICLIAEIDGEPVGYLAAGLKEFSYRLSKYVELENMGVSPQHRSSGIGTKLINRFYELAKERGYQRVYVNAYFLNNKAVEFYRRCGFSEIDISLEKAL